MRHTLFTKYTIETFYYNDSETAYIRAAARWLEPLLLPPCVRSAVAGAPRARRARHGADEGHWLTALCAGL